MFPLRKRQLIRGAEGHVKAGLGVAADYIASYVELIKPFDGILTKSWGEEGGNWLTLTRPNGDVIKFAHLDRYVNLNAKVGEVMAITGNTGRITSGPHLHIEVYKDGKRIDPETYGWDTNTFSITVFNYDPIVETLVERVREYTNGALELSLRKSEVKFMAPEIGIPTQDASIYPFLEQQTITTNAVIIFYPRNIMSVYASAAYYPKRNIVYAAIPTPTSTDIIIHEFLHVLRDYIRINKIAPIEDGETHATRFQDAFKELTPYFHRIGAPTEEYMYRLVRAKKDIYRIKDAKKDLFLNKRSFEALDGRWASVDEIPQVELDAIPDGDVLIAVANE